MASLRPMSALLLWAGLLLQADGLVLRNSTKKAAHHQESVEARDKHLLGCLTQKRIVFIGPSTAKMDYLALAYFAEYGRWPSDEQILLPQGQWGPNPMNEGAINSFTMPTQPVHKAGCMSGGNGETCFRYTNSLFNGHEACDCYEFGNWAGPGDWYNSTENRVYVNGNTMISYFQWFGDVVPPRGTFDITPLMKMPPAVPVQTCPVGQFRGKWAWVMSLKQFLVDVVRHSKPTHVVLSTSFWPINPLNKAFWNDIAAAGVKTVMDSGGQIIWRTTPQRTGPHPPYRTPRLDLTNFLASGWKVFPAEQIVRYFKGTMQATDDGVFYDGAHLRPGSQCFLMQNFLQSHVCPGMT